MAVGEGKFVLYSSIDPPLEAGDYRLTASQALGASGPDGALDPDELPVAELATHLRVRSPRFVLPPDQVLSTFPPANSEGSYGLRLPQIVIKRRTLPWERRLAGAPARTPWLALVVIAEGEAQLVTNEDAAKCVTAGVTLTGPLDVEKGNCLEVRRSVVHRVFPTRKDVPLLAHAREVDINDTELMMGDDDGFLAVVIANRLPLPGRDAEGAEVPVKYLACLVNLEGQFNVLLPESPPPAPLTLYPRVEAALLGSIANWDHRTMGMGSTGTSGPAPKALAGTTVVREVASTHTQANIAAARESGWSVPSPGAHSEIYAEMARPFARADLGTRVTDVLDPTCRFPVLLHWSFTSAGQTTFRSLMENLDSGLLGTLGEERRAALKGRPPLEVVETGHVGLVHRTRRGDEVRAWYRSPFVPHPTADAAAGRLPLAHASDQLRIVVPDGREDLSLSSAFEIGRLLALSHPSMIAALLRWRQGHYQVARRAAVWESYRDFLGALELDLARITPALGLDLGRRLAHAIVERPETFLGDPRGLVDPGRTLAVESVTKTLAAGFAVPERVFRGELGTVTERLRETEVPLRASILENVTASPSAPLRSALQGTLDRQVTSLALDTLAPVLDVMADVRTPISKRAKPKRRAKRKPDALDRLLDRLEEDTP